MNIALMGFKGCGKGAVGEALAKKLNKKFIDLDHVMEEIYEREHGEHLNYREIYQKHGKDFFRDLEHKAVENVSGEKDAVIALGGGTIIYKNNLELLKKNTKLVYLTASPETLLERIKARGVPAFLDENDLVGSMKKELEKRKPVYEKAADCVVDTENLSVEEIAEKIVSLLEETK